jgi:hypothetical protein
MTKRIKLLNSIIAATAATVTFFAAISPSHAIACAERDAMMSRLNSKFNEQLRAIGMVSATGVLEVLVSKNGTWTILMTMANGRSCLVASGQHWEQVATPFESDQPAA